MRAAWASKRKMVIRSFWKWVGKWLSVSASLCQCSLFKRETAGSRPRVAAERPVVARVRWREDVLSTSSGHASPCFVVFFSSSSSTRLPLEFCSGEEIPDILNCFICFWREKKPKLLRKDFVFGALNWSCQNQSSDRPTSTTRLLCHGGSRVIRNRSNVSWHLLQKLFGGCRSSVLLESNRIQFIGIDVKRLHLIGDWPDCPSCDSKCIQAIHFQSGCCYSVASIFKLFVFGNKRRERKHISIEKFVDKNIRKNVKFESIYLGVSF